MPGAGIAKTNPMTTAVEACKLGFAGFMVPFAFCYNPAMMMQGSVGEIISVAISAIIGVAIMSAGFQGWLLWKLNWLERIVFIAGGLLMFIPGHADGYRRSCDRGRSASRQREEVGEGPQVHHGQAQGQAGAEVSSAEPDTEYEGPEKGPSYFLIDRAPGARYTVA